MHSYAAGRQGRPQVIIADPVFGQLVSGPLASAVPAPPTAAFSRTCLYGVRAGKKSTAGKKKDTDISGI